MHNLHQWGEELSPLVLLKTSNVLGLKDTIDGRFPVAVCLLLCGSFLGRRGSKSIIDGVVIPCLLALACSVRKATR